MSNLLSTKTLLGLAASVVIAATAGRASAQEAQDYDDDGDAQYAQTPEPDYAPPAPQALPAPPATAPAQQPYVAQPYVVDVPAQQAPASNGQWVYVREYGWVWMPYGDSYVYTPVDNTNPYAYIYRPTIGWTWVSAPWVYGWGARPYFGHIGGTHYAWYRHYRAPVRPGVYAHYRGGYTVHRPAYQYRAPAHNYRTYTAPVRYRAPVRTYSAPSRISVGIGVRGGFHGRSGHHR